MKNIYRARRYVAAVIVLSGVVIALVNSSEMYQQQHSTPSSQPVPVAGTALAALANIEIKGRAPKTGYTRTQFGNGWEVRGGCDTRNIILNRDMTNVAASQDCKVQSGTLNDPYTGTVIQFKRGAGTSDSVQIDHVVALSDAWQKGAQQLSPASREQLANDPLELLAVQGKANQDKSDGDAATWLPPNKAFRCQYVARQIAVKLKYKLWVSQAESDAIKSILTQCPTQTLPSSQGN